MMLTKIRKIVRRVLKPAGYSTFFFVLFTFFLITTMPFDRFIPSVENLMGETLGRKVKIGSLSTSMTGGIIFKGQNERAEDKQFYGDDIGQDQAGDKHSRDGGQPPIGRGFFLLAHFLNSASTVMEIPPRIEKSARILHHRGFRTFTTSSRIRLVTCS